MCFNSQAHSMYGTWRTLHGIWTE